MAEMSPHADDGKIPEDELKNSSHDANYIQQLIKEGEPNWLTHQYVDRPCCVLGVGLLLLFIISGASTGLGYYDLTP